MKAQKAKNSHPRMRLPIISTARGDLIACLTLLLSGTLIFHHILPTFSVYYGDDGPFIAHLASMYSKTFPYFFWDPYFYSGHPVVGFGSAVFSILAFLIKTGIGVSSAFYYAFWFYFILMGLSLYFLARQLSSIWVALGLPFVGWSAGTLWNATIWGGSIDRPFSLVFLYIGVAATYRYAKMGNSATKKAYFLALLTWILALLANKHITFQFLMLAPLMLVFSYGTLWTGIKKMLMLAVPSLALTFLDWGRLLDYFLSTPNLSAQNDLTLFPISFLYTSGKQFEHTVGYLPLPTILIAALFIVLKKKTKMEPARKGLIVAMITAGSYYAIMGWVPLLWSFLPRFEATLDNVANLGALFMFGIPALLGILEGFPAQSAMNGSDGGQL